MQYNSLVSRENTLIEIVDISNWGGTDDGGERARCAAVSEAAERLSVAKVTTTVRQINLRSCVLFCGVKQYKIQGVGGISQYSTYRGQ